MRPKSQTHSWWECPKCDARYESPIPGTRAVSHTPKSITEKAHRMKRVRRSNVDKLA